MKNIKLLLSTSMILAITTSVQVNGMGRLERTMSDMQKENTDRMNRWQSVLKNTQNNTSMSSSEKSAMIRAVEEEISKYQKRLNKLNDMSRNLGSYSIEQIKDAGTSGERW